RAQARDAARAVGSRFVAVVAVLLVVLVGGSLLLGRGGGPDEVRPGERLPVFAAPLATAPKLESDFVNLAERADQGAAGKRPACSIRHPSVVTSCALLRRGPLVLVTFRPVGECLDVVDRVDRLVARTPGLTGLAVATGDDHDDAARTVRERRWRLRTVYDVDGALSSRLGGAVCPLTLVVRADGTVARRVSGRPETGELERAVAAAGDASARPATTTAAAPAPGR
ncbi:TlpA family protein disulfide reductase, partial [Patulibacter sp. S7RM1-6]